jgi:uncharacterized protein
LVMTGAYNVVDADGHILGPLELWAKDMDPKFRDRAPRIVKDDGATERLIIDDSRVVVLNRQMMWKMAARV